MIFLVLAALVAAVVTAFPLSEKRAEARDSTPAAVAEERAYFDLIRGDS